MDLIEIKLSKQIPVYHFQARMDIGVEEDRDDLYSILLLAQENSNQLTPELIQQKLLIDTPIIACELLVKTLQDLSLIDQNGVITETGKEVLDTKKFP